MCNNYNRCGRHCNCGCTCPPTNQSNKTILTGIAGVSFLEAYREYYPDDTRTDKEIIDDQFRLPAVAVPDSAPVSPIEYDRVSSQAVLDELRALKQSLIDGGYLQPNS